MLNNDPNLFSNIHNFYKIKVKLHFVAIIFYVLVLILSIVIVVLFFDSYDDLLSDNLETTTATLPSSVNVLITLLTICGIAGGALSFTNAILGIVGYTKFDLIPLIANNEPLRTKALLSLILGWTFPLGAFIVDWLLVKNIHKINFHNGTSEKKSVLNQ